MLKQEKNMTPEELQYVKESLEKLITPDKQEIFEKCYNLITNEINKTNLNIAKIEKDIDVLETREKNEESAIVTIGGIITAVFFYLTHKIKFIDGVIVAIISTLIGKFMDFYRIEKEKQKYVDLDEAEEKLSKLEKKEEKVLKIGRYINQVEDFIHNN